MTLAVLKEKVAHLSTDDQRKLTAYLVALQRSHDKAFRRKLAQKIDDKDTSHWVDLKALEKRFKR